MYYKIREAIPAMRSGFLVLVLVLLFTTSLVTNDVVARSFGRVKPPARSETQEGPIESDPAKLELEVVKLYKAGKYDEAAPLAKRVLKIREASLPANDPLLADSMGNLAMIYLAKGKLDDAGSLLKRALSIYEQSPEKNAFVMAKTLDSLASVRLFKSDVKKAEEFSLKSLSIKEKTLNSDHEEILSSLKNLANLYSDHREYAKAAAMLQRIISLKEQKLGDSDTQVGRLLERRACLMYQANDKVEAEKVEARANHILYSDLATKPEPIELPKQAFLCKLINNPRPDFISIVQARRFPGQITMDVAVETDEAGNVTSARLIGGDPAFKSVAESAARAAKLRPTIVDGRGVKVEGVISHMFMSTTRTVLVRGVTSRP
jgi:tetratricopeptide (TPR) repeat protein